jgi:predicted thioesterase
VKPVAVDTQYRYAIPTGRQHTAEAFGNEGVPVVGTPALIGFLETAADRCLRPYYEDREGSLGTLVDIVHLAPAPRDALVEARARLIAIDGRRYRFAVEAFWNDTPLMKGTHERVVVDLDRFLAKLNGPARA